MYLNEAREPARDTARAFSSKVIHPETEVPTRDKDGDGRVPGNRTSLQHKKARAGQAPYRDRRASGGQGEGRPCRATAGAFCGS